MKKSMKHYKDPGTATAEADEAVAEATPAQVTDEPVQETAPVEE